MKAASTANCDEGLRVKVVDLSPLVPGSINDQIATAVIALGNYATRPRLRGSIKCDAPILEIAIDAMVRDGYLHVAEEGHYVLDAQLRDEYQYPSHASTTAAEVEQPLPAEPTKVCTGQYSCGQTKPVSEFYRGTKNCKRCVLARQADLKRNGKPLPSTGANARSPAVEKLYELRIVEAPPPAAEERAPAAPFPTPPPLGNKLVIPASGEVTCELQSSGYTVSIKQFDREIICTLEQLFALCTWGRSIVVAASKPSSSSQRTEG